MTVFKENLVLEVLKLTYFSQSIIASIKLLLKLTDTQSRGKALHIRIHHENTQVAHKRFCKLKGRQGEGTKFCHAQIQILPSVKGQIFTSQYSKASL